MKLKCKNERTIAWSGDLRDELKGKYFHIEVKRLAARIHIFDVLISKNQQQTWAHYEKDFLDASLQALVFVPHRLARHRLLQYSHRAALVDANVSKNLDYVASRVAL